MNTVDRYAVMGSPVAHSKSPQIHQQFAEQTGQKLSYEKLLVEPGTLKDAVETFHKNNGKGLNITVPLKEEAFQLADELSDRAQRAGAVNTLIIGETTISGENTDGTGLVRDLTQNHETALKDMDILILGAGGAVRGILEPFIQQIPASITIANRTLARAEKLAENFADLFTIRPLPFDALQGMDFDIIINGTAASLSGELPPLPDTLFRNGTVCYDMMYGKEETTFNRWCRENGCKKTLDGLGMLVEQAAESFYLWRGVRPETAPVIEILRSGL